MTEQTALLRVEDLKTWFPIHSGVFRRTTGHVKAVDGVSLQIGPGETLGVVGESGCGKSTLLRSVARLIKPTEGRVVMDGLDVLNLSKSELNDLRCDMQIVFQDPYSSLDPRMSISSIIQEPLVIHKRGSKEERLARVRQLLDLVGLPATAVNRYPHEFSGGQRQRVGIARALALEPKLVLLDEPVSALDVSVQAQVVNLLTDLQDEMGLSYMFIAHDISVVRQVSDRIMVMYLGKVMEVGDVATITTRPEHPYTQALLSAVPIPDPKRERRRRETRTILSGDLPSPANPPSGCVFRTRCPKAQDICAEEVPELKNRVTDHPVACHFAEPMATDISA